MTEKELKKLNRMDLLKIMLEQQRQIDRLDEALDAARQETAEAKEALKREKEAQSVRETLLAQQEQIGRLKERLSLLEGEKRNEKAEAGIPAGIDAKAAEGARTGEKPSGISRLKERISSIKGETEGRETESELPKEPDKKTEEEIRTDKGAKDALPGIRMDKEPVTETRRETTGTGRES